MQAPRLLGAVLVLAITLPGCGVTGRSLPQMVSDTALLTQVKSRLTVTEGFSSITGVHVRTHDDWVELSGVVRDSATRDRIEREARRLAGDNRVVNNLEVVGQPSATSRTE